MNFFPNVRRGHRLAGLTTWSTDMVSSVAKAGVVTGIAAGPNLSVVLELIFVKRFSID